MSADGVPWLPGVFRPLYHAIPDNQRATDFGGVIVLWAACGAPVTPWAGSTLPYQSCPDCERLVGPMPTTNPARHGQRKE
ncbi:hypothetical protein LWP59_38400 [Amycolatopsis acidiphila]|uniref:hypothetical protein n=1 Tax=Amycolatopsis acidiphila TaxID=715473 RepID=UPI0019AF7FD1|nr:hypothetical protein [Amycolatopsis acidiphila]UIJ59779.1 hypothetical protein LWP59_38255 [Amycolatopsis acidiphila]UIJ59798.1 hypothetical protein LWP59_38400 [Amycolatopsis acidiphila]GHG98691.1 hypothetical protein GCM10017788_78870 [Amycolatopsis acidiphila]